MSGKGKHRRAKIVPGRSYISLQETPKVVDIAPDINIIFEKYKDTVNAIVVPRATPPEFYTLNAAALGLDDNYKSIITMLEKVIKTPSESLQYLAHLGHELYQEILNNDLVKETIAVAETENRPLRIDFTSSCFTFPFGLLYTKDPLIHLDARYFLGIGHVINRIPKGILKNRPALLGESDATLSYAVYSRLRYAVECEIPRLKRLSLKRGSIHQIQVKHLGVFDSNKGIQSFEDLRTSLRFHGSKVIHFACHAWSGAEGKAAAFKIDKDFEVSTSNLSKRGNDKLEAAPIVFLNACEMGFDAGNSFRSFMDLFFAMNVRAIIAPECKIGDDAASRFASAFYKFFIRQHHPLAYAVWLARQELLDRNDLAGLAYSVFGQPEAYLAPAFQNYETG